VGGQISVESTRKGDTTVHLDNHGKAGGFSLPESSQKFLVFVTSANYYKILYAFKDGVNKLKKAAL